LDSWPGRTRALARITHLVVLASLVSVVVRTRLGDGSGSDVGLGGAALLTCLAFVSVVCVWGARGRPLVSMAESAAALLAWLPLGVTGDLSCTDCGFALLVPIALVVPQVGLLGLVLLWTRLRPDR
jgi:hypothetical protein